MPEYGVSPADTDGIPRVNVLITSCPRCDTPVQVDGIPVEVFYAWESGAPVRELSVEQRLMLNSGYHVACFESEVADDPYPPGSVA